MDLARKTNTPLHPWNDKQNIYDSSGKLLPDEKSDKLSSLLWQFIEEAFTHSAATGKDIPESESLYDFIKLKVKEHVEDEEDVEILLQMSQMWGAYVGDQVTKQSLRFAWMEQCCGGGESSITFQSSKDVDGCTAEGETFVESTWEAILGEIAKVPIEKAEVRLGEKIVGIETNERNIKGSKVSLTTDKGETLSFDEVVITTPLGWLKRNKGAFNPALPPRLLNGIDAISVGHLEKVYQQLGASIFVLSFDISFRSTLLSLLHFGLTHHLLLYRQTYLPRKEQKQKTHFQATQTGYLPPTPNPPIPPAGLPNVGTSHPSLLPTATQP